MCLIYLEIIFSIYSFYLRSPCLFFAPRPEIGYMLFGLGGLHIEENKYWAMKITLVA